MFTTAPTPQSPGHWIVPKFGPPSVLKWETLPQLPPPAKGQLTVRIQAAGISGADNVWRAGGYPGFGIEPGFTPGYDFVGAVDAVGDEVEGFEMGDVVACLMGGFGGYATYWTGGASEVVKLRRDDDVLKMAALPLNYMTAYGMLRRSGVELGRGSSVLIGGVSGAVGTAVAQLVKSFDMGIVMFGTCSKANFDYVKGLGVTPIDRHTGDLVGEVRRLTGGRGVDVVYDSVGSKQSLDDSLAATKDGAGSVVCMGTFSTVREDGSGLVEGAFNAFEYVEKQERMSFFVVTYGYLFKDRQLWCSDFEAVVQKVRDGALEPIVGKLFRLSEAVEANQALVEGSGGRGKMLFVVDEALARKHGLV